MVVAGFFSHRSSADARCVANHLDLKADSTNWRAVFRYPHGSGVLSQLAVFLDSETEGYRLRPTSPDKSFYSLGENKTFDFHVKRKGRPERGIENQGPMAAFLTFRIKLIGSRLGLLLSFRGM